MLQPELVGLEREDKVHKTVGRDGGKHEDGHLAGHHGHHPGRLAQPTGAPGVGVQDVAAPIEDVHRGDDEHVDAHEQVRAAQVDDEEGRDARPVCVQAPRHDEDVADQGEHTQHPDAHLKAYH